MRTVPEPRLQKRADYSRRQWLQMVGAAGASMTALRVNADDVAGARAVDVAAPIDAHVHVWTPDTERYPLAAGFRRDEMKPRSFTPEELLEHARPCGVGRVVLIQMSFYGFDNSFMLDTIRRFPGVYAGVAVIDDSSPDLPTQMRDLRRQGVRGFRIYPRNLPVDRGLAGEGMQSMWK